jgi:acyl-CoA synthetase (AMP-forming)/AMP-acid ligase II
VEYNLADLFELAVDTFADREYLVADGVRRTYGELEARANRLAHHLAAEGVGPGDHVGIYAYNRVEWVETLWAVFKLRAVWININYRYVADELRYLFENSDVVAMVVERQFAPRVAALASALPKLRHLVIVDDSSGAEIPAAVEGMSISLFEEALAAHSPDRDFGPRSPDDRYILFTGGTTGLPKGVVWRHEDVLFALGGGIDALTGERMDHPERLAEKGVAQNFQVTFLPLAPLMHGASQWAVMGQSFVGNKIVLIGRFDAAAAWDLVESEKVNSIMMTGDAMARPLIEELERDPERHDTSSLLSVSSTAAIFSPDVKEAFFTYFPDLIMTDAIGSSESGANGIVMLRAGETAMRGGPTVKPIGDTVVLNEQLHPLPPGSGEIGLLARSGHIPIGYHRDPEKTERTFLEVDGTRYVITGDLATFEVDGSITLLGRGSVSINTGGEKVFPEEVEAAVKSHPDVYDATVIGVPDERWGQRIAAVVEPRPDREPTLESIQAHCRTKIAGYKVPRELHLVDKVVRSPAGKPDYRGALETAAGDRPIHEAAAMSADDVKANKGE